MELRKSIMWACLVGLLFCNPLLAQDNPGSATEAAEKTGEVTADVDADTPDKDAAETTDQPSDDPASDKTSEGESGQDKTGADDGASEESPAKEDATDGDATDNNGEPAKDPADTDEGPAKEDEPATKDAPEDSAGADAADDDSGDDDSGDDDSGDDDSGGPATDGESVDDGDADAPAPEEDEEDKPLTLEDVDAKADEAALAGHNAWMLTCTALVLFMTAPGLAMFYSGLVRKKNVLGVMMQCIFLMGLMTVLWALYGYSLAFGGDSPWFGNGEYLLMENVQRSWPEGAEGPVEPMFNEDENYRIPLLTHMLFQGMFFIITPALICGAFAERMKFSTMVVFMILWGTFVYCPLCHWVWDGGILGFVTTEDMDAGKGVGWMGGALDFAGGTVVHISSGVSALVCALLIGKRLGFGHEDMRPHNLTYTALGAAMLWVGWFGFNAGSELASDHLTSSAFAVTHFSAAAGAVAWALMEWITRGKPSVLGAASGAVAGLVCITPAAGFVNPMPALIMGAAAGVICYFACGTIKSAFGYDDSLDAFGVHGVGGTLGAILTGVFATRACWDIDNGNRLGLIEGETRVFIGQLVAVAVTWIFSLVATFIILKVLDATMGLRVSHEEEVQGLDLTQHGEEGYIFV